MLLLLLLLLLLLMMMMMMMKEYHVSLPHPHLLLPVLVRLGCGLCGVEGVCVQGQACV